MGRYYDADAIEQNGSEISRFYGYSPFRAPPTGKSYVAVMDNGAYRIAASVTREREYKDFHESYSQGYWLTMKLYQIPTEKLRDCPDQGRRPSTYVQNYLKTLDT